MKNRNSKSGESNKQVMIIIDGVPASANPLNLCDEHRKTVHGEFLGTPVNSPAFRNVGKNTVVYWPNAHKKDRARSMDKAHFGMLAIGFLEDAGFTVTPPKAA